MSTMMENRSLSELLVYGAGFLSLLAFVKAAVRVYHRRQIMQGILGPPSPSFWIGNDMDIRYQAEVGDAEFKWMREYGTAWRIHKCIGETALMVADPKAMQYILHTSGYHFPKQRDIRPVLRFIVGDGIVWVEGQDHQRHRKVMNPAFSGAQLRSFVSLFHRAAAKLTSKWKDEVLERDASGTPVIDITKWMSRITLDVIGEAGFNYNFGALDNSDNALNAVYKNLFIDSTLYPSKINTVFKSFWRYLPDPVTKYFRYFPGREYTRFRHYLDFIRGIARDIMVKSDEAGEGKDILSVLVRANRSENPKMKLTDHEVIDQVSTLLLAGHDTTAVSVTWTLWELAKHPEYQVKIREEIAATRERVAARGDTEFSIADLEGLTMMQAALKEAMRLHPIVWNLFREAGRDDVIPLAFPVVTKIGEEINAIPVAKGQTIQLSIATYNRLPQVWGEDADLFRPERFLEKDKDTMTSVGVYANLLNFSGGLRGCIGWRFSVLEMQTILSALIENFHFALPDNAKEMKIMRKPTDVMVPMVEGHMEMGSWMGLKVTSVL